MFGSHPSDLYMLFVSFLLFHASNSSFFIPTRKSWAVDALPPMIQAKSRTTSLEFRSCVKTWQNFTVNLIRSLSFSFKKNTNVNCSTVDTYYIWPWTSKMGELESTWLGGGEWISMVTKQLRSCVVDPKHNEYRQHHDEHPCGPDSEKIQSSIQDSCHASISWRNN